MDWDDEFDEMIHGTGLTGSMLDEVSEERLDPMEITNPASAYLFLSDDAQDEITGSDKRKMKCLTCGHHFTGEIYDSCPKCASLDTEELLSFIDDEDDGEEGDNMKCLDCGHTFVGEIYDSCPECYGFNTEETVDEQNDEYS